jgi:peptide deformylase
MSKQLKYYKGDLIEYEIYKLVDFYDDILRKPTVPFDFTAPDAFKKAEYIGFSLAETLGELEGLGISANQVGLPIRVCAINMGKEIWTLFNPYIVEKSEELSAFSEGCLSYPGLYLNLKRPNSIVVKFNAIGGQEVTERFDGLTAVCVQHELDHLDGIVYTDKVSPIKLDIAKRKVKTNLKKMKRMAFQMPPAEFVKEIKANPTEPSQIPGFTIANT